MDLSGSVEWLQRYAVVILPVLVVAEQIGIPLPAVPALLAVGALAAQGRVSICAGESARSRWSPSRLTSCGTRSAVAAGPACSRGSADCPWSPTSACGGPRIIFLRSRRAGAARRRNSSRG